MKEKKTTAVDELDRLFFADLSRWSDQKAKKSDAWKSDEEQLIGIIQGAIEESFWTNLKSLKTSREMWIHLKSETQNYERGNLLAAYAQFYDLKYHQGERLTDFISRGQLAFEKISESCPHSPPEYMACYRILSAMPNKYDSIIQSCCQLSNEELTIARIKAKFALEDSRIANHSKE